MKPNGPNIIFKIFERTKNQTYRKSEERKLLSRLKTDVNRESKVNIASELINKTLSLTREQERI